MKRRRTRARRYGETEKRFVLGRVAELPSSYLLASSADAPRRYTGSRRIARITRATVTTYLDSEQVVAHIYWVDDVGMRGLTTGSPASVHVQQLLARAEREGVRVHHEQVGP